MNRTDILVIAPHPDDAEIGCSGTILLAKGKGKQVIVADLSWGEKASRGTMEQRKTERTIASELLGLTERICLNMPDTQISKNVSHLSALIELIRDTQPQIILAPPLKDRHPDHANAGALVREACFYSGVCTVGSNKPFRPQNLYHYMIHQPFEPSFLIDITAVWEQRMHIIQSYQSQLDEQLCGVSTALSSGNFIESLDARAKFYGAMIGVRYAEPFFCEGPVGLKELPEVTREHTTSSTFQNYKMFL